ncbi:MAG: hypothetical protein Q7O66_16680 [Dehalococcoidia bacterium]|nr:hypothetical protein [Dehalococcoidia bacterium]
MAVSATHRGWLTKHNEGILAAVYNGAQPGTTLLAANTALDGVFLGTPVVPALAVDTMVISNMVASGDILIAANNGGNSQAWLWIDSSAGTMALYAAGVEQIRTAVGAYVINEGSADIDFRVETDGIQYAIYSDGGKNSLVLGSNTDTSDANKLVNISRAARTATAATDYADLFVNPVGAVSTSGATNTVSTLTLGEPNITVASGTLDNATVLYFGNAQPTEGTTTNSTILFGAAANIACSTSLRFNDDSQDVDFRFEGANNANMLVLDGGTDSAAVGAAVVTGAFLNINGSVVNRALTTSVGVEEHHPAGTFTSTNANPTTIAIGARIFVGIPTLDGANAGQTTSDAATVYIAGAPAAGSGNMTLTRVYSLWVDAGTTALDGRTIIGGNLAAPIHDINIATAVIFNETGDDIDFRIEGADNANMLVIDAATNTMGIAGAVVADSIVTITAATLAATGRALKISATMAAAALTDGYGAFEVDVTLSGSPTDHSAASSSWVNITGGTVPVGTYICARNDGIYEAEAATITNAKLIFGARMQYLASDTDALRFPFSLNTNNTAITALFDCQNRSDFGLVGAAGTAENQLLPILRDAAGNIRYVMLYTN